jgi:prophage regulatory protein
MQRDILDVLLIDPGQRTFGQLAQERREALLEIRRLRRILDERSAGTKATIQSTPDNLGPSSIAAPVTTMRPGTLLRRRDVSEMLGIAASTIYRMIQDREFPRPITIGPRAVRWRIEDIEKSLQQEKGPRSVSS